MVLDTLEILIEADRSGLESQLKKAGSSIQQFVSSMNKQEVSWTQILSKSITPALIGGIAATFAMAVTQALQFQNSMQAASLGAKDSFAGNTAKMTGAVYDVSAATGKSANDVAAALGTIQQVYKDTATAQGMLNVVSEEASIRNEDAAAMAAKLIPLFQQWGINSAPEASKATAILNDAVKNGTIGFDDLVNGLTSAGAALSKYTDLGSTAAQVELVSAQPGMDAASAMAGLKTIVEGVENPLAQVNILMGNMSDKVKNGGVAEAFSTIATKIQDAGGVANALYASIGLNSEEMQHFKNVSLDALKSVNDASVLLVKNTKDLGTQMEENMTPTKKLQAAWNSFVSVLQQFVLPPLLYALTGLLQMIADDIIIVVNAFKTMGTAISDTFSGEGIFEGVKKFVAGLENLMTAGGYDKLRSSSAGQMMTDGIMPTKASASGAGSNNYVNINQIINAPEGGAQMTANTINKTIQDYSQNQTHI